MSNLDQAPTEVACSASPQDAQPEDAAGLAPVSIITPREVPLGGPRAMRVRRTLPSRDRTMIGAWCFVDHYGPDPVTAGGMVVPPHPHTGLQTLSWLFTGQIEHRDSLGTRAMVEPGEVNLMTAGRGIAHSEVSTDAVATLHGVQLWVALPDEARHTDPAFAHHRPPAVPVTAGPGEATIRVLVGSLGVPDRGVLDSPVATFSPLLGAEIILTAGSRLTLDVDPEHEHGVLVDAGPVLLQQTELARGDLGYQEPGHRQLHLQAGAADARVLLLGGTPFGEQILMWWNFIGRSHDEVAGYREQYQAEISGQRAPSQFGRVDYDGAALPAPALPGVRLRPRG